MLFYKHTATDTLHSRVKQLMRLRAVKVIKNLYEQGAGVPFCFVRGTHVLHTLAPSLN
ncbi:hypothetical protein TB927.1.3730 [Trypanosoma brucei brucei TREU927]|uniref:Uncharacterized protein n=1 Tax=Trypanosoma brucei brucei (strain 927/4 GUTat10.1) TaxID=185431 RepID=Q4GYK2_TRYB2|nr:hypothetical protein TB927.1.3730 [Trypanosoma brucei brucei TREU927]CAJ16582.1 hypothetical protein TB927.1.3730 [Trypanosoma brucei brucei TREU927]